MPDLTSRAEEALLGALITDPGQLASVPGLTPADFTDPARQAVFTAITELRALEPGASGAELAGLISGAAGDPQVNPGYLAQITGATPTPTAADVYGRMVLEARLDRQLGAHAARTAAEADEPAAVTDILQAYSRNLGAAREAAGEAPREAAPPPGDPQAALEERFLAALMREPALTDWVTLDPQVFTSPARREVYEAIVTMDQFGEPVDELTLTWALARDAALSDTETGRVTSPDTITAAIPPGMIARLAAAPSDPFDGVEAARDLLAARARAQIAEAIGAARGPGQHGITSSAARPAAAWEHAIGSEPLLGRPPDPQLGRDTPQLRHEGS